MDKIWTRLSKNKFLKLFLKRALHAGNVIIWTAVVRFRHTNIHLHFTHIIWLFRIIRKLPIITP